MKPLCHFFLYFLQVTWFPIKYTKRMNILCAFKILGGSGGIRAIQGAKCDQLTQCLKRHGIK